MHMCLRASIHVLCAARGVLQAFHCGLLLAVEQAKQVCCCVQAGTSMWFYTWQDCDFIYATRNREKYCDDSFKTCAPYPNVQKNDGSLDEASGLQQQLQYMKEAYDTFKGGAGNKYWQEYYARGHCKLNHLGARYTQASPSSGQGVRPMHTSFPLRAFHRPVAQDSLGVSRCPTLFMEMS